MLSNSIQQITVYLIKINTLKSEFKKIFCAMQKMSLNIKYAIIIRLNLV